MRLIQPKETPETNKEDVRVDVQEPKNQNLAHLYQRRRLEATIGAT